MVVPCRFGLVSEAPKKVFVIQYFVPDTSAFYLGNWWDFATNLGRPHDRGQTDRSESGPPEAREAEREAQEEATGAGKLGLGDGREGAEALGRKPAPCQERTV